MLSQKLLFFVNLQPEEWGAPAGELGEEGGAGCGRRGWLVGGAAAGEVAGGRGGGGRRRP